MSARVGVVQFPGTNCELDVVHSITQLGGEAEILFHTERTLRGVDAVVVPGGFAHGDYLRTGAIARFSPVMDAVAEHAASGGPVVGICNGFQVLCEAGLLPGALQKNAGLKFLCTTVAVRVETVDTVLTGAAEPGQVLRIPVNHFEGNYVCAPETLAALRAEDRVVVRYLENPNGSLDDIAGVCNEARNVVGLMPHPERASDVLLGSADGQVLLRSLLQAATDRAVPVARDRAMTPAQSALVAALREHAIREGTFTLASGRTSSWYLDGRQVAFRGDCLELVGEAIVEALGTVGVEALDFDAVGGPVVGAIPVALAVAFVTGKPSFAIRPEPKGHGVGGRIAGVLEPGQKVLVVEDTATSGGSLLDALAPLDEMGCPIVAVSLMLDRGGVLAAKLADRGIAYAPVLGAPDLGYEFGS